MSNIPEKTLTKIKRDMENGDLGKARDRLHGLIFTYPDDLEIRKSLGDVYYALHDPAMAGRYWYLGENKTPDMMKACQTFEKSLGNDPHLIARAIKFKGNPEILKELNLDSEVKLPTKVKEKLENPYEDEDGTWEDRLFMAGCIALILCIIFLILTGMYTVFTWLF